MVGAFNSSIACLLAGWIALESAWACQDQHLYSTGRIMEIDRCASAWLIKRFVDPQAGFAFYEDGSIVDCGTPFDIPGARLSRTHNQATFEVLLDYFQLDDQGLETLGRAIHELEINFWGGARQGRLAQKLSLEVSAIIKANREPERCLAKCLDYFDRLMEQLNAENSEKGNSEQ